MSIDKLKSRFFTGAFITDVKHYFSKINEIIDWINNSVSAIGIGGSGTTNYVSKFTAAGSIGNSQIFDNGTSVGINTASPVEKLTIKASNLDGLGIYNTSNQKDIWGFANTNDGGSLRLFYNGTETIALTGNTYSSYINNGQNFGIGLSSPQHKLDVVGNSVKYKFTTDRNILFNGYSGTSHIFSINDTLNVYQDLAIYVKNLGIGTSSPTSMVHIKGVDATSSNYSLKVENSASTSLLSVRNDGFVSINGITNGYAKLEIVSGTTQGIYVTGTSSFNINSVVTSGTAITGQASTGIALNGTVSNSNGIMLYLEGTGGGKIIRAFYDGRFSINAGASPTAMLHVNGSDNTSSNYALKIDNSTSNPLFYVRNDGVVIANNLPTSATGLPAGAIWRNGNVLNIV